MSKKNKISTVMSAILSLVLLVQCKKEQEEPKPSGRPIISAEVNLDPALVAEGKQTFRYNTFGDESFWTDVLHMDKAILGQGNGGYGPGVSPQTALSVGLKVDEEALPQAVKDALAAGQVDLTDPATTLSLLELDAVVGLKGSFDGNGNLDEVGITCALCHSTVDNSFAPGIGKRLDGWPNRDLNVGAIVNLSDNLMPVADLLTVDENTLRTVLDGWGAGHYNAVVFLDGKATNPQGEIVANLIPPAYGMQGLDLVTYTGWGDLTYWNKLVATLEMNGHGPLHDTRLDDPVKYPIAAANGFGHTNDTPDLVSSKLDGLRHYQLSLDPPVPPAGSFNPNKAARGKKLFENKANCVSCHLPNIFADNVLHTPAEIGIDSFEADRSPTGKYRTTPLRGLFSRSNGGYYHDGRFADLHEVVDHYDQHFDLKLTATEKTDLVEYLKSI